jgi:hypothetical protein
MVPNNSKRKLYYADNRDLKLPVVFRVPKREYLDFWLLRPIEANSQLS